MDITYTALGGLQAAETQVNRAASLIARSPYSMTGQQDEVSLSDAAVSMLEGKASFNANLDSIKVADKMEKSALGLVK